MHGVSGGGAVSAAFRNMFADNLNPADTQVWGLLQPLGCPIDFATASV
jgi:hypothetical protein